MFKGWNFPLDYRLKMSVGSTCTIVKLITSSHTEQIQVKNPGRWRAWPSNSSWKSNASAPLLFHKIWAKENWQEPPLKSMIRERVIVIIVFIYASWRIMNEWPVYLHSLIHWNSNILKHTERGTVGNSLQHSNSAKDRINKDQDCLQKHNSMCVLDDKTYIYLGTVAWPWPVFKIWRRINQCF